MKKSEFAKLNSALVDISMFGVTLQPNKISVAVY